MTAFNVAPMRNNNVAYLTRMRDQIRLDPPYQRQGAVWSVEKKRLLIDSLLNGLDVPKIYFHEHSTPLDIEGRRIRYSLIDGRQRLEAIWGYIDGEFALATDFKLFEDDSSTTAGKTFEELKATDDFLAATLMSIALDVMLIKTDDMELIEEMFSRLNEAVPLNAAERRNGKGGALRPIVSQLVEHPFFRDKLPFDNRRYRQYDLALKFLLWTSKGGPVDAKKLQLDEFWEVNSENAADMDALRLRVEGVLNSMIPTFEDADRLLTNVGVVSVYFLSFEHRLREGIQLPDRRKLLAFNEARNLASFEDEEALPKEQRDYLEFDRLAQRQTDASALKARLDVLDNFVDLH